MGGYGSGSWNSLNSRRAVEDGLTLDIGYLLREKLIRPGGFSSGTLRWSRNGEEFASISYWFRDTDEELCLTLKYKWRDEPVELPIPLRSTPAHFGGERLWLTCPFCSRNEKLSKLYLPSGSKHFACRRCHNLTYTSCQESHKFDSMFKFLALQTGASPKEIKSILFK